MANCCGKKIETPYCPLCGKQWTDDPIRGLVHHIEVLVKQQETILKRCADWDAEHPDRAPDRNREQRGIDRRKKKAKYEQWLDFLLCIQQQILQKKLKNKKGSK